MAVKKTGPGGVAPEPLATGFKLTGGTTTQKVLTVSADATIDQDLQQSASPTFAGLTIDANAITSIEDVAATLTDNDAAVPTSAALIDYIGTLGLTGMVQVLTDDLGPAVVGKRYIANKAGTVCAITLPATFAAGDRIEVMGMGATGWKIVAAAGDTIQVADLTTKAAGYVGNIGVFGTIVLVAETADTTWNAVVTAAYSVEIS